jgi:hypothetical protein
MIAGSKRRSIAKVRESARNPAKMRAVGRRVVESSYALGANGSGIS